MAERYKLVPHPTHEASGYKTQIVNEIEVWGKEVTYDLDHKSIRVMQL